MPLVKLLVSRASADSVQGKGTVLDMSDDEAKRHVDDGLGEYVNTPPPKAPQAEAAINKTPKETAKKKHVV